MHIEHIAIYVQDIERMKDFYVQYFNASANDMYVNEQKLFSSYFLTFESGARLELMHQPKIAAVMNQLEQGIGLAHFAVSVGSKEQVDKLTELFQSDGFSVVGAPRTTGDGYYESVIKDPEGNLIEITI